MSRTLLQRTPQLHEYLTGQKVVAVVGFHPSVGRAAHYVPEYLHRQGWQVIPVNPALAARGATYFGEPARATLAEIGQPIDIVNVFRRSDKVAGHVDDILAMQPLPKLVWLQVGIHSPEAAQRFTAAGIAVVQDRCIMVDYRALK